MVCPVPPSSRPLPPCLCPRSPATDLLPNLPSQPWRGAPWRSPDPLRGWWRSSAWPPWRLRRPSSPRRPPPFSAPPPAAIWSRRRWGPPPPRRSWTHPWRRRQRLPPKGRRARGTLMGRRRRPRRRRPPSRTLASASPRRPSRPTSRCGTTMAGGPRTRPLGRSSPS
ncbi:hypothetical protein BU14_0428s0006 [Porphyra umbilicalis]|uniref:Uncharacterized protein n=1 Tax=Porphyra umbilicalis TaxID=2786 RepID=A0A1X6NV84_PORUM|nr:hypothetical protein BU14_0428s0006 [Porphyra umbilicalis]|eukprot:OSX72502.1 hypothetical protein BU14_0428s0006 [Porphyra umbilicalis]